MSGKQVATKSEKDEDPTGDGYVNKFGFECQTCCGLIPMPNEWHSNWIVSHYSETTDELLSGLWASGV